MAGIDFDLVFIDKSGERREKVRITKAVVGGWTARDQAGLQHHIEREITHADDIRVLSNRG